MDNVSSKIEHQELKGGYKQKVIEAVKSRNVDQLVSALQSINQTLTGLETGHFSAGAGIAGLRKEIADFFQEAERYGDASVVVYLGDGGLSRLVLTIEEKENVGIKLTDNSTDKVKDAWKELQ